MELNMPNPDAKDFPEAYGIMPERQNELSIQLDKMVNGYGWNPILVRTQHIVADIASFCNGPEELVYCIILHMGWHQRRGLQLAPR